MKYLLMLDTPFWLVLSGSLTAYVFALRRRIAGLKDPRLWLSRGERRAWAREELQRQEFERDTETINHFKGNSQ
jgi:hypothetical protein